MSNPTALQKYTIQQEWYVGTRIEPDLDISKPRQVYLATDVNAYLNERMAGAVVVVALKERVAKLEGELQTLTGSMHSLSKSLIAANADTERFEREWYLRGDRIEQLEGALQAIKANGRTLTMSGVERVYQVAVEALGGKDE